MKTIKQHLIQFPEYYLIVLVLVTGYTPPLSFSPFSLVLAAVVVLQIRFKNKVFGLLLGILFFMINLYMLGALISEFNEFTTFNSKAKELLFVGLSLWMVNLLASILMIYKYLKNTAVNSSQVEYKQ